MPYWLQAIITLTLMTEVVVFHDVLLKCEGITKSTLSPLPAPTGLFWYRISIKICYKSSLL